MQPLHFKRRSAQWPKFQSSSSQKAGCNLEVGEDPVTRLKFQSSSSQKAGCNLIRRCTARRRLRWCFNPHPARRPDATCLHGVVSGARPSHVSILIQPEGRMQPGGRTILLDVDISGFQSSSSQKAGCNTELIRSFIVAQFKFQSSSSQKAGCNRSCPPHPPRQSCFNPHPARRPDATLTLWAQRRPPNQFQSSSSQKAGCNRRGNRRVLGVP